MGIAYALTRERGVKHGPAMRIIPIFALSLVLPALSAFAAKPPPLGADESPGKPSASAPPLRGPAPPEGRAAATGSGFIVGEGRVLTNNHVVEGCPRIAARNAAGQRVSATLVGTDTRRDLAVLNVPHGFGPPLVFRDSPAVRIGEPVVTYGFPLTGVLSSGPTLTTGSVSALAGLRDNPLHFTISAPVQPGNSGGPLLDGQAHVVGVVVAKLNAMQIAKMTGGDIPQNVNFAIKGPEAAAFLSGRGSPVRHEASTGADLSPAVIGERVAASVVFIQCYK
jgi:S1-C subfamily serine protease